MTRFSWFPGLWRRVGFGVALIAFVTVMATLAYAWLGLSWLDALYQTVITISTVGFREVGDEPVDGTTYKIITIAVILSGTSAVLYTIGMLIEATLEGHLSDRVRSRRMKRELDAISGHVIVCGWGQVGRAIAAGVISGGERVVVVDLKPIEAASANEAVFVCGDATDDDLLRHAGIERAKALVVALDTDAAIVYVTLSGRSMNSDVFIVARATGSTSEPKLFRAGADRVVNPHEIGGARMAALVMSPNVADFMGVVMHDRELEFGLVEFAVTEGGPLCTKPLAELDFESHGAVVVAVRLEDGHFVHRPPRSSRLEPGQTLIVLGPSRELENMENSLT